MERKLAHTVYHSSRKLAYTVCHSSILFFNLHRSFCSSLKKHSQIYRWRSRKREGCRWNLKKKKKEENRDVEKNNVWDGALKKKRKEENGDVEKEKKKKPKKEKIQRKEYVMCLLHAKSMSHLMVNWWFATSGILLKTKISYKVVFCKKKLD